MRTILALISSALIFGASAWAQDPAADFPNKPIKIVVSVPAGGGVDTVTRIVAEGLHQRLGQPVVVENRAGAAGNIAGEFVVTSDPDGYTLLAAQPAPLTINPLLYKKMNFDPTQFEPVAIMTTIANVLLVRPDFPAKTAKEFIAYAKANPGKINYASQGIGTTSHLTAALFEKVTGTKLVHVPYRGTSPALNDLIASHVDFIFMELASAIKLHEGGRARILAVATAQTHCQPAGHSDARRSRREGLRVGHLERHRRAAQDAGRDRRQAQQGGQRSAQEPGSAGALRQDQPARRRRQPGRSQGLHPEGNHALGQRDQRGEGAGELANAPITIHCHGQRLFASRSVHFRFNFQTADKRQRPYSLLAPGRPSPFPSPS